MDATLLLIGWVAIPACAVWFAAYLRRRRLHSVRKGVLIAALAVFGLAFLTLATNSTSIAGAFVVALSFGAGAAIVGVLILALIRSLGNDIPW